MDGRDRDGAREGSSAGLADNAGFPASVVSMGFGHDTVQ